MSVFLTPAGRRRLVDRITAARTAYLAVAADNPDALASGDTSGWHDNFAFEENQRQMHQLARRVHELEAILQAAVVVRPPVAPRHVALGTRVTWLEEDGTERTVVIASHQDGDPGAGRIAYDTPVAKQLIGAVEGDVRRIEVAGRAIDVEIAVVRPVPEEAA